MKSFQVEIAGTTPLICNRFTDEAQASASSGTKIASNGDRGTPTEIAEKKLYRGADGETIIIPAPNAFRCLIDAGKFFKSGRSKITTQKSSLIPACLSLGGLHNAVELPIISPEPWRVDTRPVRIPATGGRILAHRPMFDEWKLQFFLDLDEEFMTPKLLREIVDSAGKRIGLGDFRPDCKGMFGKFVVTNWEDVTGAEKLAA